MSHPRNQLDEIIHQPVRFSIVALLVAAKRAEFSFVRDGVEISDSLLSRHITLLEDAGYVNVEKGYVGKRPRTWLSLTSKGRRAFETHVVALREIASGVTAPNESVPARTGRSGE